EHWALAALESKQKAHIFQLIGNTDTFAYEPSTEDKFAAEKNLCGGCMVGGVESDQLEWIKQKLAEVSVIRNKPEEFDCQTWVVEALRSLKYAKLPGVEINEVSDKNIRTELKAEKERWNIGEDTLEDSLLTSTFLSFQASRRQ
ncbi:hypothetical protein BDZ97DRAFT_1827419, partial [Flammula alnicola]